MLRRLFIISILILLFAAPFAYSEETKERIRGPITITSASLTADNKAHTALFENNVIAKTTDMSIYADRMLVYYKEDGGEVTKIDAAGNVKVHRDSKVITAQKAVYFADEEKIVFTGEPRAIDGENMITGTKMTFLINEDRSYVENSKVFLKSKKDK